MVASGSPTMIAGSYPAVSLVSINPAGSHDHPARDARALAQGRLSLLLALEVAPSGRATADRPEAARVDPATVRGRTRRGPKRPTTASCARPAVSTAAGILWRTTMIARLQAHFGRQVFGEHPFAPTPDVPS